MTPEEEVRYLVLAAQREGNRLLAELLRPLGLTPAQAEVLRCLEDAEPLALNALGRRLVCETGSPSRLVSAVVERGLVARVENPGDRRQVELTLTPEGRRLAAEVRRVEARLHGWLAEKLGRDGLNALAGPLRTLLEGTPGGAAVAERMTGRKRL